MPDPADEPLDDLDRAVLAELAAAYAAADPPPPDLDTRVAFALSLADDGFELEVARLSRDELIGSGARAAADPTRTLTFDCPSLTVMITVIPTADDRRLIDGWIAPDGSHDVQIRAGGGQVTRSVRSDDGGRFTVADLPAGLAQITIRPPGSGPDQSGRAVVTPAVVL
jgi:hypothetical protein